LAVESDDIGLMLEFVKVNLERNRRLIQLAGLNEYEKYPNQSAYKSRLLDVLVSALSRQGIAKDENFHAPSLNAYHFSNYGSNARVTVYALPSSTVSFVKSANHGEYKAVWQRIVAAARYEDKSESEELQQKAPKLSQRNVLYEDLFELPENARAFLRHYFLRKRLRGVKNDPRTNYALATDSDLLSWGLTELFLKRIMNMEKTRIDHLRELGDRLANYIQEFDQHKMLRTIYSTRYYWELRKELTKAIRKFAQEAKPGQEPLVNFDGFIKIFEEGDEFEKQDWTLARDLLLIRIFEQLYLTGYLSKVAEDLQTEDDNDSNN
jgi:CRISPR-associated protein Cst1